jgi:polyferredoxin
LIGWFYFAKLGLLAAILLASVYVSRFFCQVICPLGALFSLFNKVSLFQIKLDDNACKSCGVCAKRFCPVGLKAETEANNTACIKCGECQKCPTEAVTTGIDF